LADSDPSYDKYSWIKTAYILTDNENYKSIYHYRSFLPFQISGGDTQEPNNPHTPKEWMDVIEKCNALIVSWFGNENPFQLKQYRKIIHYAIAKGKHLLSLVPLLSNNNMRLKRLALRKDVKFEFPEITYQNYSEIMSFAKGIENQRTPIIGVFKTPAVTGNDYLLELNLKRVFSQRGYHIGLIGSEIICDLIGFDFTLPLTQIKSADIRQIPIDFYIPLIKSVASILSKSGMELIFYRPYGSTYGMTGKPFAALDALSSIAFLYGLRPDGYLLLCAQDDDIETIKNCIKTLNSVARSEPISIIIENCTKKQHAKIADLKKTFKLPIFRHFNNSSYIEIFHQIVSYLS
jgi:hypothetical protein